MSSSSQSSDIETNTQQISPENVEENLQFVNQAIIDLANERQRRVVEYAQKIFSPENKGVMQVRLRIPTGEKITNVLGEVENVYKEDEYETKTYTYHKLAASDWNLFKLKSAEMLNETKKGDLADQVKIQDINTRLYEFMALKCLKMTHDEFVRVVWDDMRLAVDASSHVTEWAAADVEAITNKQMKIINKYPVKDNMVDPLNPKKRLVNKVEPPIIIDEVAPIEDNNTAVVVEEEVKESKDSSSNTDYGKDYDY